MNNYGSRQYIIQRRRMSRAATLGDTWYEKLGKGALNVGSTVLSWYTGSKQQEATSAALAEVVKARQEATANVVKFGLVGGGILLAAYLLKD